MEDPDQIAPEGREGSQLHTITAVAAGAQEGPPPKRPQPGPGQEGTSSCFTLINPARAELLDSLSAPMVPSQADKRGRKQPAPGSCAMFVSPGPGKSGRIGSTASSPQLSSQDAAVTHSTVPA